MKNSGNEADAAFVARVNAHADSIVQRFYDQSDLRGLNGGRPVGDFAKPADYIITVAGTVSYAEVKSVQGEVSFPFGNIEDGQRSAALRHAAVGAGDCYNFYLFSYGTSRWYVMSATVFAATLAQGKKSIKFEELPLWT